MEFSKRFLSVFAFLVIGLSSLFPTLSASAQTPVALVTINQSDGTKDPTNYSPIQFTVIFQQPINLATFTSDDIEVISTATIDSISIVEDIPFDYTTFSVYIEASGTGVVTASVKAGSVENLLGQTNAASISTDNTVTFSEDLLFQSLGNQLDGGNDGAGQSFTAPSSGCILSGISVAPNSTGTFTLKVYEGLPQNDVELHSQSVTLSDTVVNTGGLVQYFTLQTFPINPAIPLVPGAQYSFGILGVMPAFATDTDHAGDSFSAGDLYTLTAGSWAVSLNRDLAFKIDCGAPQVTSTSLQSTYPNGSGPNQADVKFSAAVVDFPGHSNSDDVTNPDNFLLVDLGANGAADTTSCAGGVSGDDRQVSVNQISYTPANSTATISFNNGAPLDSGLYRMIVCGTTSINNLDGEALAGDSTTSGTDYAFDFTVTAPNPTPTPTPSNTGTSTDLTPPETGFSPGKITLLPPQPASKAYAGTQLILEIPSLDVEMPIVGVPQSEDGWDVTWLGENAGWLNGTAFPTWSGNTVLTGHKQNAFDQPGPFANLNDLKYGDQILIHAFGMTYTYEVRESKIFWAGTDFHRVIQHEELDWVTLVTCELFNPFKDAYTFRRVVSAVLVSME